MTDREVRLDAIRREIDALDAELLVLLNRRGRAALEVAAIKGCHAAPRYYRPEREAALLRRLAAANPGPLSGDEVIRLFREIVSTCRALEKSLVVGCATAAEACAAIGYFGGAVDLRFLPDCAEALDAVATARCDHAMIEFFRQGLASPVVVELHQRGLVLCGEWYARSGERFVAVGREPVPPTGCDWTSVILPTRQLMRVESWCRDSNLEFRSFPVSGAESSTVLEVAAHVSEPRLAQLVALSGDGVLGAYPDSRAGSGPQ